MRREKFFEKSCGLVFAALLIFCAALTGCAGRKVQFLPEEESGEMITQAEQENVSGIVDSREQTWEKKQQTEGNEGIQMPHESGGTDNAQVIMVTPTMPPEIYVDVCGAVKNPGVYQLEADSRVFQAVEAAGGFLSQAADDYVNRAGCLTDGQQIYIPTRKEAEEWSLSAEKGHGSDVQGTNSSHNGESVVNNSGNVGNSGSSTAEAESAPVNLNTADETQLTTLPGIGASKARAIIAYREANGGFSAIEEIMNVEGIKEGTFSKIKDDIEVR